jgi:hypothetical protein
MSRLEAGCLRLQAWCIFRCPPRVWLGHSEERHVRAAHLLSRSAWCPDIPRHEIDADLTCLFPMLTECRSRNCRIGEAYRKEALKPPPYSLAYAAVATIRRPSRRRLEHSNVRRGNGRIVLGDIERIRTISSLRALSRTIVRVRLRSTSPGLPMATPSLLGTPARRPACARSDVA